MAIRVIKSSFTALPENIDNLFACNRVSAMIWNKTLEKAKEYSKANDGDAGRSRKHNVRNDNPTGLYPPCRHVFLLSHVLNSEKNCFACKKNTFEGVMAVFSSILATNLFFLFFFMGFLRQARFAFIGNPFSYFFTAILGFFLIFFYCYA